MVNEPSEPAEGTFWQVETPQRRSPGRLDVTGDRPTLETVRPIFSERKFEVTRTTHGIRRDSVRLRRRC